MGDEGVGGIDMELGIKKQIPEVVKEIFTPEQIDEYRQLFKLYDFNNEGVINLHMVPKILAKVQHQYKPEDLQQAMKEIDISKGTEIDEMIFLQIAAKCYLQSWSKKQILKAFRILNLPKKRRYIDSAVLKYFMTELGEPLNMSELKLFMFLADPIQESGKIFYKEIINKLGEKVPRKSQKSRIKTEIKVSTPKKAEALLKRSIEKGIVPEVSVKKSKSLDKLLKSIDRVREKSTLYVKEFTDIYEEDTAEIVDESEDVE